MNYDSFIWLEGRIEKYISDPEDIKIEDFHFHPDDKNSIAFIIKRVNEIKHKYHELDGDNSDKGNKERYDLVTRAAMLFSGLALFEYEE